MARPRRIWSNSAATVETIEVQARDRILLLSVPDVSLALSLARQAFQGMVVGLGEDEQVRGARQIARNCVNVMFVPGGPDQIPWRDGFFTVVIDTMCHWANPQKVIAEVVRILGAGGLVHLRNLSPEHLPLLEPGFDQLEPAPRWTLRKKP